MKQQYDEGGASLATDRAYINALEAENARLKVMEEFKVDVCRRAATDQHGWSQWVANWGRERGASDDRPDA